MPQEANVVQLWDGAARTNIEVVYVARDGDVVTADYDMVCYYDRSRPPEAPTEKEMTYWSTPKKIK